MNQLGKDSSDINLEFDVILHALRLNTIISYESTFTKQDIIFVKLKTIIYQ